MFLLHNSSAKGNLKPATSVGVVDENMDNKFQPVSNLVLYYFPQFWHCWLYGTESQYKLVN